MAICQLEYYLKRNLRSCSFLMTTRFAYIAVLLIFAPLLLSANSNKKLIDPVKIRTNKERLTGFGLTDTTKSKKPEQDDKKKIKEIAKTKKQPKPEKLEPPANDTKRAKRQRRPDGLERPPEIPRRNG
jgi:hypothetical protein